MSRRLVANITDFDAELKLKGFKANEIESENCIVGNIPPTSIIISKG
jgi:hypothetical protein